MAIILDGKKIAGLIRAEIKKEVGQLRARGIVPKLAVILAGDDPASVIYARSKEKACLNAGISYELFNLPGGIPEDELMFLIGKLNKDENVHGIIIELPLPEGINKQRVLEAVSPLKDIDGVHPVNRGYLVSNSDGLFPATPQSCIEIMQRGGIEIESKHAVLVGRGETVGKPLVFMMLNQNATVTVCHTKTSDLGRHTRQADILITAVGKAKMITADLIKPGAVVIDAGINETAEGICGDVDYENVQKVAGAVSPVPGGVGSLTTVLVQRNLLKAIKLQKK
ncbi:bifunctional 5,10-methylenetetrahydrofolate dehydrogenase/5,10-methenyltetrahydrofolate cyclohydrolase [Pelotomaculum terephthalicicum JT]|uniref:bifunctional 5,10-methylenetetrahydrofolate dehydrogenase/5,10-methenyltetrahydrofolate cyclohydrolase n=1 Tax=Pelotomaculum TaxID=191373 RepID=UPI0009CDBE6F|nr:MULTISPECIES: bifunctional 5,10-methylenetetrahydrofolate dehydrogenase/5,10-methenyltetrahydrofolate cyclohydrolase [Pelotomaculum]MCG9968524.1 bifunctional 5,10-methylenetetrahydrofolate dehydrogenase/5,10-methenyltetrahydrofolate cyclohydrolase [Pelotomaculum terephthalicicum JT]OPX85035.1 MAG: Bifunctional protein FolD protein [Pelotomaculum sp. PtaB.Bin117]OPY62765.1 MAG: Bifunctional protein FolD protein [Pelotomaculum sp. PtaU1.Bin065]